MREEIAGAEICAAGNGVGTEESAQRRSHLSNREHPSTWTFHIVRVTLRGPIHRNRSEPWTIHTKKQPILGNGRA